MKSLDPWNSSPHPCLGLNIFISLHYFALIFILTLGFSCLNLNLLKLNCSLLKSFSRAPDFFSLDNAWFYKFVG